MTTAAKTIIALAATWVASGALGPAVSHAQPPSFYHYYYVYPQPMSWCGKLVDEVFKNADKNWRFTNKELTETAASFSVADVRGRLRCLTKQPKETWIVIITTGNDAVKTKDLFEELRLGICGRCSSLVR